MKNYHLLAKELGYLFENEYLLETALAHRSVGSENNERLEFLGDAILGFIIAAALYQHYPQAKEGELSQMRSALVNREILADIAFELGINEAIRLGAGENKSGGRERRSILADGLEAVIGAIYLDSDLKTVQQCVLHWYGNRLTDILLTVTKDPKSQLQEWLQARKKPLPIYEAIITGEAHAQTFTVTCRVVGLPYETTGISTNRRSAEQIAAQYYLDRINE